MSSPTRPLFAIAFVTVLVAACGGASGNADLFAGSSGSSSGSSGSSSGSSGSSSGSSGSSSGSSGSSSGSSGSSSGSSGFVDGGKLDAAPDAADASTDPGIFCGKNNGGVNYCTPHAQVCCAADVSSGNPTYTCHSSGTSCPSLAIPIACDDGTDCGGETCCGRFNGTTGYRSIQCQPTCEGTAPNGDQYVRFCNPNGPDECSALGLTCQASGSLIGYYRCN